MKTDADRSRNLSQLSTFDCAPVPSRSRPRRAARLIIAAWIALLAIYAHAAPGDEHHDVVLDPAEGKFTTETTFTVSFPGPMVQESAINAGDVPSPLVSQPKFDGQFLWKSTVDGELTVKGPLIPSTHYRISTAPGLKDADGHAVPSQKWEFDTDPFQVTAESEQRDVLASRPHFSLSTNYPVSLLDAADSIYFQDRDTHERLPAEVLINPDEASIEASRFTVTPRAPLPMGHTYDVIVNALRDAHSHTPLGYIHVFPAGSTDPISIKWLGGFNDAMAEPILRIKFSEDIDPDSVTADSVSITPPVGGIKAHASEDEVVVEGNFDIKQHYSVLVSTSVKGERGFGMTASSKWGATFHPKESTIIFPSGEVFQRSAAGLKFSLLQVNTGPLMWKLSAVPLEKLPAIAERAKEYKSGETPLNLQETGHGQFDANNGKEEILREIDWHPPQPLSGTYLLEASATGGDGEKISNRILICFSDYILTQKKAPDQVTMRVAKMSDGLGAPNLPVRVITSENLELARGVTDANGLVTFSTAKLFPSKTPSASLFIADTPAGPAIQYVEGPILSSADYHRDEPAAILRTLLVTDRNLYRPGQTVKMHGVLRVERNGQLALPDFKDAEWTIKTDGGDHVADGKVTVSEHGSWDGEWQIPTSLATGGYRLSCEASGYKAPESDLYFKVEEYRTPLFSVVLDPIQEPGALSQVKVSSTYFHGAPNARGKVHWKAVWATSRLLDEADDNFVRTDSYSENRLRNDEEKETEGDAMLDANGMATLHCEPPFTDGKKRGRCNVSWTVDVTSAEAQTLSAGTECRVQMANAWTGIRATTKSGVERTIEVEARAIDIDNKPVSGAPIRIELFQINTKTVKEKIAPFVVRYRNTKQFEKVATRNATAPAKLEIPVEKTGEYIAVVYGPGEVPASTTTFVSGDEQAELPVENDTEIGVTLPEPVRPYLPGEVAPLSVQAPFAGVAWVSVEAGEILDTLLVPLKGNSGQINLPIKKEYAPNATVTVYLVQPGGDNRLPRERIGELKIQVDRPDRELVVTPTLSSPSVKPGSPVHGEVTVTSENKPVAGAEFLVFAVDEAVLQLGDWQIPDAKSAFYPERGHAVATYAALSRFIEKINRRSVQQKGYVIGDGGEQPGNVAFVRKEFKTLAYWEEKAKTDAKGKIQFEFKAPDNLTSYRVVAIGNTDQSQFGAGSTTFTVSKPLLCEPALPRFVREGDEVRLRAVARQKVAASAHITVRCITEGLDLQDNKPITETAEKDVPAVFNFPARVREDSSGVKVRFEATSDIGESDTVELSLPVHAATIIRKETVSATVPGPSFQVSTVAPKAWTGSRGTFDVMLSTSPWFPKLSGLPTILEYPHGCFEQISSRVLAYSMMTDLLAGLPENGEREASYQAMLSSSMKLFRESLLADGMLPYWPGNETPNSFVTVLAAWAVREASNAGADVPAKLTDELGGALLKILKNDHVYSDMVTRSLALMVGAGSGDDGDYASVAQDLYLKRDQMPDEGRALLAVAMQRLKIMPREKAQLIKEISKPVAERAFDPGTFSSTTRNEAIATLAFAEVMPGGPMLKQRRERLLKLLDSSDSFSTQENLWLLLAFKAMHDAQPVVSIKAANVSPKPAVISKNGTAAAWLDNNIAKLATFKIDQLAAGAPLTGLVTAEYRQEKPDTQRLDRGLRVERSVRNLTDPKRAGTPDAPFKLGDQILVTYRLLSRNLHNYVALEDLIPAGLETVNPDLPMIAKSYQIPVDADGHSLELSHSELRDQVTRLYFDVLAPGTGTYSVLARATAAGKFHWPATQVAPMYDSRFTGLSASSVCVVAE